jgi:hypothetical protein
MRQHLARRCMAHRLRAAPREGARIASQRTAGAIAAASRPLPACARVQAKAHRKPRACTLAACAARRTHA